jgi:hypothetical protein
MKHFVLRVVLVLMGVSCAHAATRNVFFAGGQSNAKATWASAIASGLQAGYGADLVMVATNHSGEGLANWFTSGPNANYSNDLFNAAGTGLLQSRIHAITNAGDEVVFKGFFWFQGETDTGSYASMDAYTNRFRAMMAQLKQDLGMETDVNFMLAVIDGNPDPFYDDPANAAGRTRADVDYLRGIQTNLCVAPSGAYVDTRGYTRTDMWHLTTSELTRLGTDMSTVFTNTFGISPPPFETVSLVSHDADGAIYPTGEFSAQDLICGFTGNPLVAYNGIAFFQLPAKRIEDADLVFTVEQNYGPLPAANVDVWGLGYVRGTPALNRAWMLLGDTDTRLPINNNVPATKIADNFVAAGQATPVGGVWQLDAAQRANLKAFLNGLYEKGALPGDYVVIRINPDAVLDTASNVRWGGSHRTSPDRRTRLALTLADDGPPSATESTFTHYSHDNDGGIFATGTSTANDLISGTGGTGTQDYNGIAFLALPEQPMTAASLSFTVATFSGVMDGANIDVWGLGYMASPSLNTAWFCTNNVDTRLLLNGHPPVKIADNIVTSGQTVAVGTVWRPDDSQSKVLRQFLNSLYLRGAKPGDYAVFRVNMDARQQPRSCGVRWGGSHQTSPDRRATLSGVYPLATNYLLNAGFEEGTGPSAANWQVSFNGFLGQRTNASVRAGGFAYRMAVNGDQSGNSANNLNLYQNCNSPVFAGKAVTLSCYARHEAEEPLVVGSEQKVEIRLWWLKNGVQNGFITSTQALVPTDPTGAFKQISVTGFAPSDTTGVQAMVIFRTGTVANPAITTGAATVDDIRISVLEPVYPDGTVILLK